MRVRCLPSRRSWRSTARWIARRRSVAASPRTTRPRRPARATFPALTRARREAPRARRRARVPATTTATDDPPKISLRAPRERDDRAARRELEVSLRTVRHFMEASDAQKEEHTPRAAALVEGEHAEAAREEAAKRESTSPRSSDATRCSAIRTAWDVRGGDPFGASTAPLQGPAPLVTRERQNARVFRPWEHRGAR